jgi:hypothetical protein
MSGLGRAWVRTNVRNAKEILASITDLSEADIQYLNDVIEKGEVFLKLTAEDSVIETEEKERSRNLKTSRTSIDGCVKLNAKRAEPRIHIPYPYPIEE